MIFLDMTSKAQVTKEKKIDKLDFMKMFKICTSENCPQSKKATHKMGE